MSKRKHNKIPLLAHEWRASISLAGVYALRMLGMFLVLPVLSPYAAGLGGTAAAGGLAIGVYGFTQALLQLPLGIASDRFGRKKVIYLGLAVFALGSFLSAMADNVTLLIIGRAVQGAGAVSAAVTALLADLTREEVRTRAMSLIGLSIGVPGLFALTGFLCLAAVAVVALVTPNPTVSKLRQDADTQPSRISEVLKNRLLMQLNFGIFALQAVMMAIFASLPTVAEGLGLARTSHGMLYLPAVLLGLVLMVPAIILAETRNKMKAVFVAGILLIAAGLAGMYFGIASLLAIGAALAVYFVGFNILEASLPSIVSKVAPVDLKGTAMGVYNTAQSVGVFVGGSVGGVLFRHFGFGGVFLFSLALTLLWLAVALAAPAPKPVRNLMLALPPERRGDLGSLKSRVAALAGVEAVSFSEDGETLFVKVLQHFDEEPLQKILTGA